MATFLIGVAAATPCHPLDLPLAMTTPYLGPVSLHPPAGTDLSLERNKLIPDQVYRPAQPPAADEAMLSGVTEPWEGTADWFTGLIGLVG